MTTFSTWDVSSMSYVIDSDEICLGLQRLYNVCTLPTFTGHHVSTSLRVCNVDDILSRGNYLFVTT